MTPILWSATILAIVISISGHAEATFNSPKPRSQKLQSFVFDPLDTGSIKPEGWLLGETQALADGVAGHLYDFYDAVADAAWLKPQSPDAQDYSTMNTGFPYWFNALVGLAYALDDDRLKAQVHEAATITLGYQTDDGWIGPEVYERRNIRARMAYFWGLTQLVEANSTWEEPVVSSLRAFFPVLDSMLKDNGTGYVNCPEDIVCYWGQTRSADMDMVLQWLLDRYPHEDDPMYWDIMDMLFEQNTYKWEDWYTEENYPKVYHHPDTEDWSTWPYLHGVNVAEAFKYFAVIWRFKGEDSWRKQSKSAADMAFRYHGSSSGTILGDEAERSLAPFTAHELCTVVETIYSFSYMYSALGDNDYADRAERAAFNAYPVMMTGDKWGHQYMSQPNGPQAINVTRDFTDLPKPFTNSNSGMALVYGLEPQFPCCTVNHPQGYPRLISGSWVRVGESGIGHALLSPSTVKTMIGDSSVNVTCDTKYPFSGTLTYSVDAETGFDLHVRVPGWANKKKSTVCVTGSKASHVKPDTFSGMHKISVPSGRSEVIYNIASDTYTEPRPNNTISVFHGSIVYALDVGYSEKARSLPHAFDNPKGPGMTGFPPQLQDIQIDYSKEWNVAIDPSTLEFHGMEDEGADLPAPIFEDHTPPTYFTVQGCTINWGLYMDSHPNWAPKNRTCTGPQKEYRLIPLGGAKIHMTDLPVTSF